VGYGADSNNNTCTVCDTFTYNIEDDFIRECIYCDPDDNEGVDCESGDIVVTEDYWMGIQDDESIISGQCPSGFCCQDTECSFIYDEADLCADNRDADSFLCSECIAGYSESVYGAECVECDKDVHWEFMLLPLGMAVVMSVFILVTHTDKDVQEIQRQRANTLETGSPIRLHRQSTFTTVMLGNVKAEDTKIMLGSIVKISIYYEQGCSQILASSANSFVVSAFAGFFDFSTQRTAEGVSSDGDYWCFIDGLTLKWKILSDLSAPLLIVMICLSLFIISKFCCRKKFLFPESADPFRQKDGQLPGGGVGRIPIHSRQDPGHSV